MQIIEITAQALPEVKIIKYPRYFDERGYFSETFRLNDLLKHSEVFPAGISFLQSNESYSKGNVIRGLHFQWDSVMGKLVRCVSGHLLDIAVDIRTGSPNFGKVIMCNLPADGNSEFGQWVWLPPGFAHGVMFLKESLIEYFCTADYSPGNEGCISPFAEDLDWSLCNAELKKYFDTAKASALLISEKDRNGFTLKAWSESKNSQHFIYGKV